MPGQTDTSRCLHPRCKKPLRANKPLLRFTPLTFISAQTRREPRAEIRVLGAIRLHRTVHRSRSSRQLPHGRLRRGGGLGPSPRTATHNRFSVLNILSRVSTRAGLVGNLTITDDYRITDLSASAVYRIRYGTPTSPAASPASRSIPPRKAHATRFSRKQSSLAITRPWPHGFSEQSLWRACAWQTRGWRQLLQQRTAVVAVRARQRLHSAVSSPSPQLLCVSRCWCQCDCNGILGTR